MFLGMSKKELDQFIEMYADIKLPFWMQTRPELLMIIIWKNLNQLVYEFHLELNTETRNLEKNIR